MNSSRFDRFTTKFGSRLNRREALAASTAGLTVFGLSSQPSALAAQDATPVASPTAEKDGPAFLFVQLAEAGTWAPKPDEDGVYTLTLAAASNQTLFFSDRPERIVGTVPVERFLEQLGFSPENPPNAAVVVQTPEGERDVLVVELTNPVYRQQSGEDGANSITYDVQLLEAYEGEGLTTWVAEQADNQLPEQFSNVSLFIDDCPDAFIWCAHQNCRDQNDGGALGWRPMCWEWQTLSCGPCAGADAICHECKSTVPVCAGASCFFYDYNGFCLPIPAPSCL